MSFVKPNINYFPLANSDSEALFSIIIPSWNNLEMLKCCIQSIYDNSFYKHQIIVHINEGVDGSLAWIKEQKIDYTHSDTNAGVCYSVNAMASLSNTNYVVFLNDDMYVCKNWDKHLYDCIMSLPNTNFYISGTMIEPLASNNKCAIAPHNFGRIPEEFDRLALDEFALIVKKNDWFGSCWPPSVVHKSVWDKVGGYSEEFSPGMYSDPDFAMKLWEHGIRHFQGIGASLVYHFQSRSTGRVVKNNGRKQFAQKWGIPASYFYKNVLQLGSEFKPESKLKMNKNVAYFVAKLRASFISIS
ncbi:MAG: glycosyltransferase [Bacteroidetes bacterium]|nr:glycosyltransferase [Bacteroidota bacterium]